MWQRRGRADRTGDSPARRASALCAAVAVGVVLSPAPVAAASGDPVGSLDTISIRNRGAWAIHGWAADPDAGSDPVQIHLYRNGRRVSEGVTHDARPDVQAAVPYAGPNAGFIAMIGAAGGDRVCVYAINVGRGTNNTTLGCATIPLGGSDAGDPRAHLDSVEVTPGLMRLRGWAGDPDAPRHPSPPDGQVRDVPTTLELHLDRTVFLSEGVFGEVDRPDVRRAFPDMPNSAGFDIVRPVLPGTHGTCLYAINNGRRGVNNSTVGCSTIAVPGPRHGPTGVRGSLDELRMTTDSSGVNVTSRGWAWNQDDHAPVHIVVRSVGTGSFEPYTFSTSDSGTTGERRPDVALAHPGAPSDTGFAVQTRLFINGSSSAYNPTYLCAYGVNAGREQLLGCRLGSEMVR